MNGDIYDYRRLAGIMNSKEVAEAAAIRAFRLCALAAALLAAISIGPARPASAAQAGTRAGNGLAVNMVILVDESGTESAADVTNEADAASAIAQGLLNPRSRVSVVGFGGPDQQAPHANSTTIVCPATVTSGATNLESLARCVGKLAPRTAAQGNNTDYVGALSQALSLLAVKGAAGALNVILMMTDGGLDESGNPSYPQPDWQQAAHHAVDLKLAQARQEGVAVWPLGFGDINPPDASYLGHLAQGGSQNSCDSRTASQPRAMIAQDSATAVKEFDALYADAACVGTQSSPPGPVSPKHPRTVTVNIPIIANTAAISVYKANPRIRVNFSAPGNIPVFPGYLHGSRIEESGADTAVEVLHVTNPLPGLWTVTLIAPPGLPSQQVSATVYWQGAVRTSIVASPPNAFPGQKISVTLTVLGNNGPITDQAELSGVTVRVDVTGDGLTSPIPVTLTGRSVAGAAASDFSGTFSAPNTKGTLMFLGSATGYGLHSSNVPAFVNVVNPATSVQALVQFSAPNTVYAGSVIHGQVIFTNPTGVAEHARLVLASGSQLATMGSPAGALLIRSGRSVDPFTINLASKTTTGPAQFVVKAVNASQPSRSYGQSVLVVTVKRQPGLVRKYLWGLIAAALIVLLLLGYLYLRAARAKRSRNVQGLVARLEHDDGMDHQDLKYIGPPASEFPFVIRHAEGGAPELAAPAFGSAEPQYVARRDGPHGVIVKTPAGGTRTISFGGPGERGVIPNARLAFSDSRRPVPPVPPVRDVSQEARQGPGDWYSD